MSPSAGVYMLRSIGRFTEAASRFPVEAPPAFRAFGTSGSSSRRRLLTAAKTTNVKRRQVLLVGQLLVSGQEDIEFLLGKSQQLTVGLARPSHLRDGPDLMRRDASFELPWQRLVQQQPHRSGPLQQVRALSPPAHG